MRKSKDIEKGLLSLVLVTTLVTSFSCSSDEKSSFVAGNVDIWSTYNTMKVMREKHDYEKFSARLNVEMARSEVEGAQLVLTPDYDVREYDLLVSDLHCGENVFPKEDIAVYKQCYTNVTQKTANQKNDAYPIGWTPDMLLPMDVAKEYGENSIQSGHNQSLTIEFSSQVETVPGIYVGEFTLVVDGKETAIPVSVEVWDIDVSKTYGKSSFGYGGEMLIRGELSNTDEAHAAIYEFLLDNRMSGHGFPENCYGTNTIEGAVEGYKKYSTHKYFNSFAIPVPRASAANLPNTERIYQYLKAFALLATPEDIVFDKGYYYIVNIDEPHTQEAFDGVKNYRDGLDSAEERVLAELEEEGFFESFKEKGYEDEEISEFKEKFTYELLSLPQLITTMYNSTLKDTVNTYCPPINYYDSMFQREQYTQNESINDSEQWFYTCMNPIYPYPSFAIDDYLIGARIQKWMQAAYDVDGYLFWSVSQYHNQNNRDELSDPYTNPNSFVYQGTKVFPGDGMLLYPGYKYGSRKPFGTIRLASYRDGQEDMDLVCEFNRLLQENASYYGGVELSANGMLQSEYDKIFTGAIYNSDDSEFQSVRRLTAELYAKAKSDMKLAFTETSITDNIAKTEIYVADGYTVKVNGQDVSRTRAGQGWKYTIATNLVQSKAEYKIEIFEADGKLAYTYNRFASRKFNLLNVTENNFSSTEGTLLDFRDTGVNVSLVSKSDGTMTEQLLFTPTLTLNCNELANKIADIDDVRFKMKNDEDFDISYSVWLATDYGKYKIAQYTILAGEEKEFILENLYKTNWSSLRSANKIVFTFDNSDTDRNPYPIRRFTISDVTYSLK